MASSVRLTSSILALSAAALLAGCASDSTGLFSTGTVSTPPASVAAAPKVDPICYTLASTIDGLKKEGVAEKIEKAAGKKYKMTPTDLTKADQLNKAYTDYQGKCGSVPPSAISAEASSAASSGVTGAAKSAATSTVAAAAAKAVPKAAKAAAEAAPKAQ
jgi:hypothetical protein